MSSAKESIWTTFIDRDDYLPGLVTLIYSLRKVKSAYRMMVMLTSGVSESARDLIKALDIEIMHIEPIKPTNMAELAVDCKRFEFCWTKLRAFELTQYKRVVFLDSDMLVIQNMDELMDIDLPKGWIAGTHVCNCRSLNRSWMSGWTKEMCGLSRYVDGQPRPVTFYSLPGEHQLNSGLIVIEPDEKQLKQLQDTLTNDPIVSTLMVVEQDLLAHVYRYKFKPIHWKYNSIKRMFQSHANVYDPKEEKNVHYILGDKPWMARVQPGDEFEILNTKWWEHWNGLEAEWQGRQEWKVVARMMPPMLEQGMAGREA